MGKLYGLNSIGLQRGLFGETISALKRAYRLFFNSELNLSQALERRGATGRRRRKWIGSWPSRKSSEPGRARVSAPLPIGVVGVGAPGRHHARHLAQLEDARLVGVFDTDSARGRSVADELGTTAFPSLDALLDQAEAVTVAVPTPAHHAVGTRALGRGVPVLMEKPLAATVAEADALIAAAARGGLQLQVGHIERYNRALRAAEPYLDGPRYIESQRLAPFQPRGTDVAVVLDLMIHDLDLVLHLTGGAEATEVRASGPVAAQLPPRPRQRPGRVRQRRRRARDRQPGLARAGPAAPRCSSRTAISRSIWRAAAGEFMRVRRDWQPGHRKALTDVVERIVLEAPEADALQLELRSFVHAVRGEREVVVSGEEGRAALALALRVATRSGRRRSPFPRPDDRPAGPAHLRLRRRALGRPPWRGRGARAPRAAIPDAVIEALGGPQMAAAGATIRYPMEGLAAFGLVEVVTKLGAHLRLLRALRADFRAGRYDLVILIDYPGFHVRVAEAARAGGDQGALLHCAPALGLAAGPGPAVRVGGGPARGRAARSSSGSSAGSGSGATTSAIRWWTAARWPTPRRGARPARHSRRTSRVLGIFPGSRQPGDPPALGPVPRRRPAAAATRGAATGSSWRARRAANIPIPGPLEILARRSDPGVRRRRRGARQVGHDHARGRAGGRADGGRVQGAPADLAHVPAGPHGASG